MPLSMTQYESAYEQKKELALITAQALIAKMDARSPDIPLENCTDFTTTSIEEHKLWMKSVLEMVSSIMFSSGFWHTYTCRIHRDQKLRIVHKVSIMTLAERQFNDLEDDDGYTSDDDEPSPKSESADPAPEQSQRTE